MIRPTTGFASSLFASVELTAWTRVRPRSRVAAIAALWPWRPPDLNQ